MQIDPKVVIVFFYFRRIQRQAFSNCPSAHCPWPSPMTEPPTEIVISELLVQKQYTSASLWFESNTIPNTSPMSPLHVCVSLSLSSPRKTFFRLFAIELAPRCTYTTHILGSSHTWVLLSLERRSFHFLPGNKTLHAHKRSKHTSTYSRERLKRDYSERRFFTTTTTTTAVGEKIMCRLKSRQFLQFILELQLYQ